MQCKRIEKIAPVQPGRKEGYIITAQKNGEFLLLDVFRENNYRGRQAINTKNGEYAQYDPVSGKWSHRKFGNLLDLDMKCYGYYSWHDARDRTNIDTDKMEKMVRKALIRMTKINYTTDIFDLINRIEQNYDADKRRRIEDNRVMKVQEKMNLVPAVPKNAREWIWRMEGAEDFLFRDKGEWYCTACRKSSPAGLPRREDGEKKVRHNDRVICPNCEKTIVAKTRTDRIEKKSRFYIAQRMDDRMGVWRSFDVTMTWTADGRRIWLNEATRIIMYDIKTGSKYAGEIFYNQYPPNRAWNPEGAYFGNKDNPSQRRMGKEYLYPEGIEEALAGTAFQRCGRLISQMAAGKMKLDYNRLISTQGSHNIAGIVEYLYKGRFWRLMEETIDSISLSPYCQKEYYGSLNIYGTTIEEIFRISDRQRINRIRDMDGGKNTLEWMQLSDRTGARISQETLQWLEKNKIDPDDIRFLKNRMSPQQIMHYITRQQAEEYKGKTAKTVIGQWEDYMNMLEKLGRKMDDEMMYRPRQLKRRHDDCVDEINVRRIRDEMTRDPEKRRQEAEKMNKRFPGAEKVLADIREKYEYGDDQYIITIPRSLMDIITEGQALHHCAGATDRYFDRIMQRETYICFLRRREDPDTPYYTIEVEPGGTIRQHRGYMDEEPNIEQVRPFLRKWQQEIRRRMTKEDKKYAAASAIKRQQNIEELKANRNTRVLQGLMEDFMPQEAGELQADDLPTLLAAGA